MTYLLDTNTCIGWLRQNQPQIVARIQAQAPTNIVLCSVVVGHGGGRRSNILRFHGSTVGQARRAGEENPSSSSFL